MLESGAENTIFACCCDNGKDIGTHTEAVGTTGCCIDIACTGVVLLTVPTFVET